MVKVTQKHRRKITVFFDNFLVAARKKQRISVRSIQRMLGLQIWISTVFRVARQFITSICDILRVSGDQEYFYPRRHIVLVARAVRDLSFWRRFVSSTAKAGFDFLLCRLPVNKFRLSSDACTSFGMAGVLRFYQANASYQGFDGIFWQTKWEDWNSVVSMVNLRTGQVNINVAEYVAMLVTCETFAEFCGGKLTYLDVDNTSAHAWFEAARCPKFPIDRCGQGTQMYMLEKGMKVKTHWIPSGENVLADACSRKHFSMSASGHLFGDILLRKVKPRWRNVLKFI